MLHNMPNSLLFPTLKIIQQSSFFLSFPSVLSRLVCFSPSVKPQTNVKGTTSRLKQETKFECSQVNTSKWKGIAVKEKLEDLEHSLPFTKYLPLLWYNTSLYHRYGTTLHIYHCCGTTLHVYHCYCTTLHIYHRYGTTIHIYHRYGTSCSIFTKNIHWNVIRDSKKL